MGISISVFGSSHTDTIGCEVEGLPKGYFIDIDEVGNQLALRQNGIGRSARQIIEKNAVCVEGLDCENRTTGSTLKLYTQNGDNRLSSKPPITALRPSHADLLGCVKWGLTDARSVAEKASGRSTLPYCLAGAVCRQILRAKYGIEIISQTVSIGGIVSHKTVIFETSLRNEGNENCASDGIRYDTNTLNYDNQDSIRQRELSDFIKEITNSPVRCADGKASKQMIAAIKNAEESGDTLGGICQVIALNLPMGFGEMEYRFKLQSVISSQLMAIPSVKGIEFGLGFGFADKKGSEVLEELVVHNGKIGYSTNFCGGTIGGLASNQPLVINLAVKPIPTLRMPSKTVDILSKQEVTTHYERSDVCVVPNIGVIAENLLAIALFSYEH